MNFGGLSSSTEEYTQLATVVRLPCLIAGRQIGVGFVAN